jgi:uncharacterized membrane protein YphA (DoxX/SURF4 family)
VRTETQTRSAVGASALVALACRLAIGATFLYASLDKLADPQAFAQAVFNYRLLPPALLHPFALVMPALEATVGAALLVGVLRRGGAFLATAMTLMFTGAVTAALVRGLDISCGCFDTEASATIGFGLLVRDVGLLVLAAVPLFAPHPGWGLADLRRRRSRDKPV